MGVPAWVKYKTNIEKTLCKKLLLLNLYNDKLDLSRLASDLGYNENNFFTFPDSDIKDFMEKYGSQYLTFDSSAASAPDPMEEIKRGRGRPSTRDEMGRKWATHVRDKLLSQKNNDFPLDIQEKYSGDVVENNFVSAFSDTVQAVKEQFFADYPERIKKHPSTWFRFLCLKVKENTPKIDNNNFNLISDIWDIYSNLCLEIGINRTIENFQIFTGLSWYTIDKLKTGSSPDCIDVTKKIYDSCKSDIVGGLASSYGSSPNQMFIAKSIYGVVENTVVTHVSATENNKSVDDIPLFIEEK